MSGPRGNGRWGRYGSGVAAGGKRVVGGVVGAVVGGGGRWKGGGQDRHKEGARQMSTQVHRRNSCSRLTSSTIIVYY